MEGESSGEITSPGRLSQAGMAVGVPEVTSCLHAGGSRKLSRQSIRVEVWGEGGWARGILPQRLHLH